MGAEEKIPCPALPLCKATNHLTHLQLATHIPSVPYTSIQPDQKPSAPHWPNQKLPWNHIYASPIINCELCDTLRLTGST